MIVPRLVGLAILLGAGVAWAEPPSKKAVTVGETAKAPARPVASGAQDSAAKRAVALNDEAWSLYEAGRYRAAIDKLEEAVRLDPNGKDLVYNLALIHEKLAHFDDAATHYKRYLEMEVDPKAKARVQGVVKRLEGARHEREENREKAPVVGAPVRDIAHAPPRPVKPWVIATGSVAGAAFLLGSIFGLSAIARSPGSGARTGDGVTIDELSRDARVSHTNAVIADVAFLVAIAATGTATFLYFTTPRTPTPSASGSASTTRVCVAAAPGQLRVTW